LKSLKDECNDRECLAIAKGRNQTAQGLKFCRAGGSLALPNMIVPKVSTNNFPDRIARRFCRKYFGSIWKYINEYGVYL
jgi:hypothetical protein